MHDAVTRPLFEEPSSDSEREDPWSGPKGFMVGGLSLPNGTTWEMAEQYYDAAALLIKDIEGDRIEDYKLAAPVLFLYRHWLELAVKSIIGPVRGHNLSKLSAVLVKSLNKQGEKVPVWVTARLQEISTIDPSSTVFRYAKDSDVKDSIYGEIYVSLPHLRDSMKMLHMALGAAAQTRVFSHL